MTPSQQIADINYTQKHIKKVSISLVVHYWHNFEGCWVSVATIDGVVSRAENQVSLLFQYLDMEVGDCILFAKFANAGKFLVSSMYISTYF